MRRQETTVAVRPVQVEDLRDSATAQIVTVAAVTVDGVLHVRVEGDTLVPARLAVTATRERLLRAIAQQQPAVALFENGDRSKPIIVGFLERTATCEADSASSIAPATAVGESGTVDASRQATGLPDSPAGPVIEADVDGRRVRVTAQDEIVLECGQASVTLRRNGRVIIRGTYVETHSEGTNRIKGGQVQIN